MARPHGRGHLHPRQPLHADPIRTPPRIPTKGIGWVRRDRRDARDVSSEGSSTGALTMNPAPTKHARASLAVAALASLALAGIAARGGSIGAEKPWRARYDRALADARLRAQESLVLELELRPLPASWAEAWTVESDHYAITLMQSRGLGTQLARGLDTMLGHFEELLGAPSRSEQRFPIQLFPDLAAYNVFGNANGAEHSSFYGSFFAAGVDGGVVASCFHDNSILMRMWLTHGALHQYLSAAFDQDAPDWIEEGLASYFSLYWDPAYGASELERLRAGRGARGLFSLQALLDAPTSAYIDRPQDRLLQLGMFFNYLLHYREDTRTKAPEDAPFAEYLQLVMMGEDLEGHPVHELLTQRRAELEAGFAATQFAR